ncbi:hypothetical protein EOM60_04370 [Candidatus Saccharibacteria bacterium]|nr:hypothetical protein [Candidatus Saccharibacteria bacterium]
MSDQVTKSDLRNLEQRMDKRFDDPVSLMSSFTNDTQTKFDVIESRFDVMESRFDKQNKEFRKLSERHDLQLLLSLPRLCFTTVEA